MKYLFCSIICGIPIERNGLNRMCQHERIIVQYKNKAKMSYILVRVSMLTSLGLSATDYKGQPKWDEAMFVIYQVGHVYDKSPLARMNMTWSVGHPTPHRGWGHMGLICAANLSYRKVQLKSLTIMFIVAILHFYNVILA